MSQGVHLLPATELPPHLTPARLFLLADAGWADDLCVERSDAQDSWVCRVAGADGHQAAYKFHDDRATVTLSLLTLFPDGGGNKIPRGTGWGRWKFGRLIDAWAVCGYTTCRIDSALGNRRSKTWTGYYVWPRFGFDGFMSKAQHARLPSNYRGSRRVSDLLAAPGGPDVWRRFGGVLYNLTFDLTPGSDSRRRFGC